MFYKAYNAYLDHAFPEDELQPLSCTGKRFPLTAGNMLTLVDTMDTLVVLENFTEFARVVKIVSEHANYDLDDVRILLSLFTSS